MGVDISTYRARIGSFGPRLGKTDSGSIGITATSLVLLIGAVIFIRQLLVIGGIEQNPGPPTGMEFTFRYQYLLIEIGTRVLRQLFDHLVKNDFGQYLNNNPAADTQLQHLILRKVIATDQQQVLPPIDTKPSSKNFDVTLLCCLLRNVCGLKLFSNNSWIKPTLTDNSLEANITRLRECRNELYHSGSVFSSAVDLDAKWKNLCKILNDLNTVSKIPNLTSLMNYAEKMDIDEKLKKHYDMVLHVWTMADNTEELIHGQTLLLDGQSTLTKGQSQLKLSQRELKDGQSQIINSLSQQTAGQTQLKDGQSQIINSQTQQAVGHLKLTEGQTQLKDGQSQIINSLSQQTEGQTQLKDGQSQIINSLTQQTEGQTQLKDGQSQIINSLTQQTEGQTQLKDGQSQIINSLSQQTEGQTQLKDGQSQIINSLSQQTEGQTQLKDGQSQVINSLSQQTEGQTQLKDGQSQIINSLTQQTAGQTQLKDGQSQIINSLSQQTEGQTQLKDGQSQIINSLSQQTEGQTQLKDGQSQIINSLSQQTEGQTQLKDGQSQIINSLSQQTEGQTQLKDGQSQIIHSLTQQTAGQTQLKDGQSQIINSLSQQTEGQTQLKDGQSQIINSLSQQTEGQTQLKDGQSQIINSLAQHTEGQTQLKEGQSQIINSLSQQAEGQTQLNDGQSQIINSLTQQTEGQTQLKDGQSQIINSLTQQTEGQTQLKDGQSNILHTLDSINHNLQESKQKMLINESELKNHLITIYNEECSTLPVLPLCEGDDDERELLSFYQPPSLNHKPYRESQGKDEYEVLSYKEIFNKDDKHFRKVYITGDAGTGKTSLCKRMVLLWCKAMSGKTVGDKIVQNDIDLMAEFDFVFYVSLGVAKCTNIITIIAEQLFCNANDEKKNLIELILKTKRCLVIMDALDEFNENGKININKLLSDKCAFMITCRPFVIETNRLSPNDIDRQIKITGINGDSVKYYVNEIVNHMNETKGLSKLADDFVIDAHASGVYEQLHIPILGSHLVLLWFNHRLTHMSQALIYSHIIDMLLERAVTIKHVACSSSPECDVQFPDSLSELIYLKQNAAFLKKVCLLSFNLLFKKDKKLSQLVFTKAQLMSKPYHVTAQEMNYLCKFGILSKSKAIGSLGKREQKLAFLHKSYIEYFAALFVSSFDKNNDFENVVTSWKSDDDTLQHETFFRFYVGLSPTKRIQIYGDLNLEIINRIFRPYTAVILQICPYKIKSIQDMVKRVFKESRTAYEINMACLKIEHFVFYIPISDNNILKQLVKLCSDVKSLFINDQCTYLDAFDEINKLQILVLEYVSTSTFKMFTERVMLNNKSTLHTVCIANHHSTDLPFYIPFKQLNCLTSICLCDVTLQHNNYDVLITFLSNNINMENITLDNVICDCKVYYRQCLWTLDLTNKTKLKYLSLVYVNIVSKHVNLPELKFLHLNIYVTSHYIDLFNAIHSSQLTYLAVDGNTTLDSTAMKTLASTIQSLKSIRELRLRSMDIPDDVLLQFHPDVSEIKVDLHEINMSKTWFDSFIDNIPTTTSTIRVILICCQLTTGVGENYNVMSVEESVEYMYNRVIKLLNVKIFSKNIDFFYFERKASDQ